MRIVGILLTGLALAACSTPAPAPVESPPPASTTPDLQAEPVATAPTVLPPLPAEKPAMPTLPLSDLVGLEDAEVLKLIGQPERTEDRAPGVAWFYEGTDCRFGLLLYPDLETNSRTVLSVESSKDAGCAARLAIP